MLFIRFISALLLLSCAAMAQDFDKGLAAAQAGDFETGLKELRPLADNGHPRAQYVVGFAYYHGKGVQQDYAKAAHWYRLAAEQSHQSAQNTLGILYENGFGVPQDMAQAFNWYRLSADQGNEEAQLNAAFLLDNGLGVPQNLPEAARRYQLAAEKGVRLAQTRLGQMYDDGTGGEQNYVEAAHWFRLAAEQGDDYAQARLGEMYEEGLGVVQDPVEALRHYRLSAEQGNVGAQFKLAMMYNVGNGVPKDFAEAANWYHLSAEQGHAISQSNLAVLYQGGDGVAKNLTTAAHWFLKAAEQGNEYAQIKTAVIFFKGTGVEQDMHKAAYWFRKAAEQGNETALILLGNMYADGNGIPKDPWEALRLYRLAAAQGNTTAQSRVGYMYYNGIEIPRNRSAGLKWYRMAAEQGEVLAQAQLGFSYFYGRGISRDYDQAAHWYHLAAEQNYDGAQAVLGKIYTEGKGVPVDPEEGVRWYRRAAAQGYADAQIELGKIYYYGVGVAKDLEEAAHWYHLAAEQGEVKAQSKLGFMYRHGRGVPQNTERAAYWQALAAEQDMATDPEQDLMDARDTLAAAIKEFGPQSPALLGPLKVLAELYSGSLNDDEQSAAAYRRGFEISRDQLGENHETTLVFMSWYTIKLSHMGRHDQALALRQELVKRSKESLGPVHLDTLYRMGGLSVDYRNMGRAFEANQVMQEGLQIAKSVYGEVDAIVTGHLGTRSLAASDDQYSEGRIDFLTHFVDGYTETYGTRSQNVLSLKVDLAAALAGMGKHLRAAEVHQEIVDAHQDNLLLGASFDEEMRGSVVNAARGTGFSFADSAWKASARRRPGDEILVYRGQELTPEQLKKRLLEDALFASQIGQNKTAHAVARSKAKLALRQAGLNDLFADYEAKQEALHNLGIDIVAELAKRSSGGQNGGSQIYALQQQRDLAVQEIRALGDDLKAKFPRFFDLVLPQPVSVAELQGRAGASALLGQSEVLIMLSPPQDEITGKVWAISLEGAAWAEIGQSEAELRDNLSRLHAMLDGGGATLTGAVSPGTRGAFSFEEDAGSARKTGFDRALAHEIYQALLGDPAIQSVINGKPEWIIAPQGMLLSLPFTALVTDTPPGGRARDADPVALRATPWLGVERALSVVPAVSSLRVLRGFDKSSSGNADLPFFGLGDPAFDGAPNGNLELSSVAVDSYFRNSVGDPEKVRGLARLPGTRREIEKLAAVFGANKGAVLLGLNASERQLAAAQHSGVLSRSNVIVLATHGLLAGAFDGLVEPALALSPPPCGPVLIDANTPTNMETTQICEEESGTPEIDIASLKGAWVDDGLLTASEVTLLDLNAGWVILSACDTASGENQNPDAEGLSGLARAFFFAGARSLLVSHWPVRDDVAAKLTPDAVSRSAQGNVSRAEAFRQAMADLMNDPGADETGFSFAHPSAWAPFQMTGVGAIVQ